MGVNLLRNGLSLGILSVCYRVTDLSDLSESLIELQHRRLLAKTHLSVVHVVAAYARFADSQTAAGTVRQCRRAFGCLGVAGETNEISSKNRKEATSIHC